MYHGSEPDLSEEKRSKAGAVLKKKDVSLSFLKSTEKRCR